MFKIYLVIISKVVLCIAYTKLILTFHLQDYLHFNSFISVIVFKQYKIIFIVFIAFKHVKINAIAFKGIK
jgi:hypothetical protein